jgi:RNA polymerase sigma factor (sigma-70 family)
MISEVDLIMLCNKNDRKGQQILFDLYKRKVMGICLRYASSKMEADDILQEAFIKIYNSLLKNNATEINSLAAWIHRVTTNTAINIFHQEKNNMATLKLDELVEDDWFANESVLESMSEEELLQLIREMPVGFRVVFNLFIIDGFNHKEIGEKLHINESSSRSRLTRAKNWLRERLTKKEVTI